MKKQTDLNRLLFYIQDTNDCINRLQSGKSQAEDTQVVEATVQYLREYCIFERLPMDYAFIVEKLKIPVNLEIFKGEVESYSLKKEDMIFRRKYEQAALLRDREFLALSKLVRETSGSCLFFNPQQKSKIYWVIPEFSGQMKIWFLDCLYSKRNQPR